MAEVRTLRIVPVKGLRSVRRDRVRLDEDGVAEDRRLFLLDAHDDVVTLRAHPQLAQAVPDLDLPARVLAVRLPDGTRAESRLDDVAAEVRSSLFGKDRPGRVLGGDIAEALSDLAGEPVRVVLAERTGVGWDEGPVSILGRASAEAVAGPDRDRDRYRMLVEVEGTEPFEEDRWVGRDLSVGEAVVRVSHQLVRCAIITRSPETGERDVDGLKALGDTRGKDLICLGVIAEVVRPGTIARGDPVQLIP